MIQDTDFDITARFLKLKYLEQSIYMQLEDQEYKIRGILPKDNRIVFTIYYTIMTKVSYDEDGTVMGEEPFTHYFEIEANREDIVRYNYNDPYCLAEASKLAGYSHTWNKLEGRGANDGEWGRGVLRDLARRAKERFDAITKDIDSAKIFVQPTTPRQYMR